MTYNLLARLFGLRCHEVFAVLPSSIILGDAFSAVLDVLIQLTHEIWDIGMIGQYE